VQSDESNYPESVIHDIVGVNMITGSRMISEGGQARHRSGAEAQQYEEEDNAGDGDATHGRRRSHHLRNRLLLK
jgi:hypothetical protein